MADNSFKIKNSLVLTPVDLTTLVNPQAGDLACDINDSNKIKRYDANSSAWTEVGSGGVGSVDIMFVQDFESASLATFVSPTDVTLSTTDPLHGKVSALLTHDASVNKSFKQIIPVDRKFRGQAMVLDLNVKSAASAGNVTIKITDETGSVDLIASEQLQLSNDVSGTRSSVSFTIPSTCASLSYTITALPEAGSPVTRIDDIVAMLSDVSLLETSVEVPNLTAWQGYTPTFQGFGTPSNVEFEWRQVGENVEIRGKFAVGTTTATEARIGLPAGLISANTSLIPSIQNVGTFSRSSATSGPGTWSTLIEPSVSYMTLGVFNVSFGGLSKRNGNDISVVSGELLSLFASIPCAGLSATTTKTIPLTQSGLVQNADSYLEVSGNGAQAITAAVTNIPFANINQNIGSDLSWNGSQLTVLESGVYSISTEFIFSTSAIRAVDLYVNGTFYMSIGDYYNGQQSSGSCTRYFTAGDVISIRANNAGGTLVNSTSHKLSVSKAGSLKQLNVSSDQKITIPTSELRFEGASARGTGTEAAIVQFTSLAKLRGDAFTVDNSNGTAITTRKAGRLAISVSLLSASASTFQITKNQAVRTALTTTSSEVLANQAIDAAGNTASCSAIIDVEIGDIIRVASNLTPTASGINSLTLSFQEQDIAVSVTNTLPQFSESDSSVRVDTANGYGSTANKIRRFSNVRDNIGSDIAYVDDSVNGGSFTVKSAGTYHISATDNFAAQGRIVITKNQSNLTATPGGIPSSEILRASQAVSAGSCSCSWEGYLVAGDIIRLSTDGGAVGSDPSFTGLTISKVGKPNVTGVDVTPFVNVPQPDFGYYFISNSPNGFGSTYTQNPRFLSVQQNDGAGILSYTDSATLGGFWTANKNCKVDINLSGVYHTAAYNTQIYKNQTGVSTATILALEEGPANIRNGISTTVNLLAGDRISFFYSTTSMIRTAEFVSVVAEALSDQILTAPETFSTDTASLKYIAGTTDVATTLANLANQPVGTYTTFTYAAGSNTRSHTITRPTQADADMNTNGMLIYSRAYNVLSTAAQPSMIAIQIGKGLKGRSIDGYGGVAKTIPCSYDYIRIGNDTELGTLISYSEITGILTIDAGSANTSLNTSRSALRDSNIANYVNGYFVINASKNPALTGLGLNRIAARAVQSSGQSIPHNSATTVVWDSAKTFDTNGALNTSTGIFTAPETGYYQVNAGIRTNTNAGAFGSFQVRIFKNGSFFSSANQPKYATTVVTCQSYISDIVYLSKNDTVYIAAFQDSGGAISLLADASTNFFSITKVSV